MSPPPTPLTIPAPAPPPHRAQGDHLNSLGWTRESKSLPKCGIGNLRTHEHEVAAEPPTPNPPAQRSRSSFLPMEAPAEIFCVNSDANGDPIKGSMTRAHPVMGRSTHAGSYSSSSSTGDLWVGGCWGHRRCCPGHSSQVSRSSREAASPAPLFHILFEQRRG